MFSGRLDKKGALPADMSAKAKEEVRPALGISECATPAVNMIRSDRRMGILHVETFGRAVGRSINESFALILYSFTVLWILRCAHSAAMRGVLRERQILYVEKICRVSIGSAYLLRATYSNCLCFKGTRRSILLHWAVRLDCDHRRCPDLPDSYFNWATSPAPSTQRLQTILQKTHHLFDDDVAALKRAAILLDSRAVRADGHFEAPRRILTGARKERGK